MPRMFYTPYIRPPRSTVMGGRALYIPTSGADFENVCASLFKKLGFTVETTSATGDFGADLILTHEEVGHPIAVRCKSYNRTIDNSSVQEVVGALRRYGCAEGWVVTNGTFTQSAKELASANGVKLIDGETLNSMLHAVDAYADPSFVLDSLIAGSGYYDQSPSVTASQPNPAPRTEPSAKANPARQAETLYNLQDVAIRWGCTPDAVKKAISDGLPLRMQPNGRFAISESDLIAYERSIAQAKRDKERNTLIGLLAIAAFLLVGAVVFLVMTSASSCAATNSSSPATSDAETVSMPAAVTPQPSGDSSTDAAPASAPTSAPASASSSTPQAWSTTTIPKPAKPVAQPTVQPAAQPAEPQQPTPPQTYTTTQGFTGDVAETHPSASGEVWIHRTDSSGTPYYRSSVYVPGLGGSIDIADYGDSLYYVASTGQPLYYDAGAGAWVLVSEFTPWVS